MKPITGKQVAYLSRLIARRGKKKYQLAKTALGFPDVTVMRLTCRQASELIAMLKNGRAR